MFKEQFNESLLTEAKMPNLVKELIAWVDVMYPGIEVVHDPKHKPFKSKKAVGETTFMFNNFKKSSEFLHRLEKMDKFKDLYATSGLSFHAHITWPTFDSSMKMSTVEYNTLLIDTRKIANGISINRYKDVEFIYMNDKHIATYRKNTEVLYVDTKNMKLFKD